MILLVGNACSKNKLEKKGFPVNSETTEQNQGVVNDTFKFETAPRNVLLTKNNEHRLTPIYKVNYDKKNKLRFVGSNEYHSNYSDFGETNGNQWNYNFMPGFEAIYGYNFVNISHFDNKELTANNFFEDPVLIKTLYFPAFSNDTLNKKPVERNYYMVSVYDEDTNNDGFINVKDLRRFYHFDISAKLKKPLIPVNYSTMSSEYDPANDYMYIFAKIDKNNNGQMEADEPTHIFWIDLNNPEKNGIQYEMNNK